MGIEQGDTVTLNYEGKIEDGSTFHTFDEDPVTVIAGTKALVPGFEEAILGMEKGEEKEFSVSPEKGYGVLNNDLIQKIPISAFEGTEIKPEVGAFFNTPHGNCHVTGVQGDTVEISYNHPLAGHTLTYNVKIMEIAKK